MNEGIPSKVANGIKRLFTIGLFCVTLNANAIEYSAPGNPAKLRVFESGTDNLVCFSFSNFCDLPAGQYTVKIFNSLTSGADEIIEITLPENTNPTDTLASLNCEAGEVAKFLDEAWRCAQDLSSASTVFDKVAMLEDFFCTEEEMLLRDPDTGIIQCVVQVECPYASIILDTESVFSSKTIARDEPQSCLNVYLEWDGPADRQPLEWAQLNVSGGALVLDTLLLLEAGESTLIEPLDNIDEERACALLMGCNNF